MKKSEQKNNRGGGMKKYMVLKELPGAPVGTITNLGSRRIGFQNWSESCIVDLIKDGWIEEVEERNLAEKIKQEIEENGGVFLDDDYDEASERIANIAAEHYKDYFKIDDVLNVLKNKLEGITITQSQAILIKEIFEIIQSIKQDDEINYDRVEEGVKFFKK